MGNPSVLRAAGGDLAALRSPPTGPLGRWRRRPKRSEVTARPAANTPWLGEPDQGDPDAIPVDAGGRDGEAQSPRALWSDGVREGEERLNRLPLSAAATGLVGGFDVMIGVAVAAVVAGSLTKVMPAELASVVGSLAFGVGFVFITVGTVTGVVWAFIESGTSWILNPEIGFFLFTWAFYLAMIFLRVSAGWRGRRIAWLAVSVLGCSLITWATHLGIRSVWRQ